MHNINMFICSQASSLCEYISSQSHQEFILIIQRRYLSVTLFLPGGSEDVVEEAVTISAVYFEPNAAQPTQDTTKDFTPRVDTATVREKARDSTTRKPFRTEVRCAQEEKIRRTVDKEYIHL